MPQMMHDYSLHGVALFFTKIATYAPPEVFLLGSRSYDKPCEAVREPRKSLHTCTIWYRIFL